MPLQKKEFALVCAVPMDTPGVKLICRPSYEMVAAVMGSPFDYPLSSRLDENDAIFIFDKVLVPWENVFVYGDIEKANNFFPRTGFIPRFCFHGCIRLAVKLDFIAGLLLKARRGDRAPRTSAACRPRSARCSPGATCCGAWPTRWRAIRSRGSRARSCPTWTTRWPTGCSRRSATRASRRSSSRPSASGLIYLNSNAARLQEPRDPAATSTATCAARTAIDAVERVKLMKLLWDAIGTEFGGRHELYERNYSGNAENIRMEVLFSAHGHRPGRRRTRAFAEQCMAEYDLDGWTAPDLINPDDVSYFFGATEE